MVERKGSVPDVAKSREQVPTSSCREVVVLHKTETSISLTRSTRVQKGADRHEEEFRTAEREKEREKRERLLLSHGRG